MNLYHLRYFVTLAHLEHYTKAADVLAITQPSLSHAISSLEEELGVKLFEKNGRNVSLTKYGKSFLEDVEQTLNRLDSSVNGLQLAGKGEGQIDVAFLRTLGVDFMPKIIRSFLNANKGKQIHFNLFCDKVLTGDILTGLKEKKYDIGFCSKFDDEPLIEFIPVAKQDLVVIVLTGSTPSVQKEAPEQRPSHLPVPLRTPVLSRCRWEQVSVILSMISAAVLRVVLHLREYRSADHPVDV